MRFYLILAASLFAVILTPCRAQVSDSCSTKIIVPEVARVLQMLQTAKGQTDAGAKQSGIDAARREFSHRLTDATTLWACSDTLDKKFAGILEARRIDVQVGPSNGASGSTNLVPSGSVPALLGLAVEYGGLTQSFSGTTVTFRTTPAKLIGALANAYGPNANPTNDKTLSALQRVSVSVSFDTSRTSSSSTNAGSQLLANYQQLSQATARFLLINDRDPLAAKNWKKIRALSVSTPSQDVANLGRELMGPMTSLPGFDAALDKAMDAFDKLDKDNPDQDGLKNAFTTYLAEIQKLTISMPNWQQRVDAYSNARFKLDQQDKNLYKEISKAPSLTFEYDFNRPPAVSATPAGTGMPPSTSSVMSPDLSTASLVYVASVLESEYTLNVNANFFNETRAGMSGNFRDLQVGGKWDIPIGHVPSFIARGTLTFSGLYEHLHQKPLGITISIDDQKVNKPGDIGVFQAKYSIAIGDSGVQIPISVTASNRTELIKENDVRGNIGITFDLDKLLIKK